MGREYRRHDGREAPLAFERGIVLVGAAVGGGFILGKSLPGEGIVHSRAKLGVADREPLANGFLVRDGKMIALHEVFGEQLPVGFPDVVLVRHRHVTRHVVARDFGMEFGKQLGDRGGVGVQRHINPALPNLGFEFRQAIVLFFEVRRDAHVASTQHLAGEVISPAVIGAGDPAGIALT